MFGIVDVTSHHGGKTKRDCMEGEKRERDGERGPVVECRGFGAFGGSNLVGLS